MVSVETQLHEIGDGLDRNIFLLASSLYVLTVTNPYIILQIVTRILVEEGIESSEVPLAAAATASIKKEDIKNEEDTTDDEEEEEKQLSSTTTALH